MGVVRRMSALATGLLVLQLTLLGAAAPCTDHGVGDGTDGSHTQSGALMNNAATATGGHEECDGAPAEPGRTESASGSCLAMISCITPMPQLGSVLSVPDGITISRVAAVPLLEPPTRSTAPELPPPRA
jgi:hypothetical protein